MNVRTKRPRGTVPLIAAALLACATACTGGGSSPSASPSGSGGTGGTAKIAASDTNPVPAARVKNGGTLRYGLGQWVRQWNRLEVDGALQVADAPERAFLPHMYRSDTRGNVSPDPDYLSSAKVTDTKPRQVVTYKINPKAEWSTGDPITWKDFAAQWKAARGTDSHYKVASTAGYERIRDVKKGKNARTVVVTFDKPFGEWLKLFDPLYPAKYTSDPDRFNSGYANKIPVTAGPYKVAKLDTSAKTLTLERDPNWWGTRPKLNRIVFRAMKPSALSAAFAQGRLDYADIGADAAAYQQARAVKGAQVRRAAGMDYRTLTFSRDGVLKDRAVRQAIAMGIDRAGLAKADLTGLDWPVRTLDNHFFLNTQTGYRNNSGTVGSYNPQQARGMLTKLGWKPGKNGVRTRHGKALTLDFVIPEGTPASANEARAVQRTLRAIGAQVKIRSVSSADFLNKYLSRGDFDIAPFSWVGSPFPISAAESIYLSPKRGSPQQNYGHIGAEKSDKLIRSAAAELDIRKAHADMNAADQVVWTNVHSLPLYQRPDYTVARANLANIGSFGFQTPDFTAMGFTR